MVRAGTEPVRPGVGLAIGVGLAVGVGLVADVEGGERAAFVAVGGGGLATGGLAAGGLAAGGLASGGLASVRSSGSGVPLVPGAPVLE